MLLETESGIWARADATVFRLLMDGGRTERRLQAAGRTIDSARRRVAALRQRQQASDARAHAITDRQVEREFAPAWGRSVRVRMPRATSAKAPGSERVRRTALSVRAATRAIRAYKAPLLDTRGRIALYFRIRYVGLKSKNWRAGLAADHAVYILREMALENDEASLAVLSNMGADAQEIAACWNALEAMEEGYRANAKVQYRIVWNLPHDLDAQQRREMVEDFCARTFGRAGLPWVAAVHAPDAAGDQRNYHAHVCFSTRPCERVGDHQWEIAQEKVNGLTDPDGLKLMRTLAAGHMNAACRDAGLATRFTHQTYKERQIDAERQAHIGPAAMAAHERGEPVAVVERNARIVERNELAVERDAVAREVALVGRLIQLTKRRAELDAMRVRIARPLSAIRRLAETGRAMAVARPAPMRDRLVAAKRIAQRGMAVRAALAARPCARLAVTNIFKIEEIAADARLRIEQHRDAAHRRAKVNDARDHLAKVETRIKENRAKATAAQLEHARTLILNAATRPYRVVDNKVVVDVSTMAEAERAMVIAADRDVIIGALRERFRRDREREETETQAQAQSREAERVRLAAEQRRAQIAAAESALCEAIAAQRPSPNSDGEPRVIGGDGPDRTQAAVAALGGTAPPPNSVAITSGLLVPSSADEMPDVEQSGLSARQQTLALAAGYRQSLMADWSRVRRLGVAAMTETASPDQSKAAEKEAPARPWRSGVDPRDISR